MVSLQIPDGTTEIKNDAFNGRTDIVRVLIPSSVTSIGASAFRGCSSLTDVTIPSSVASIGKCAFRGCSSLADITIPSPVTSIGDHALSGCNLLTRVAIPSSVTSIGVGAFSSCSSLTEVAIPSSVTSIGRGAFQGCSSLKDVTIPSSLKYIGACAFPEGAMLSHQIPTGTTKIGDEAFKGRTDIVLVLIPSSVTSIGDYAFWGCSSLTHVTIPSSVTSITAYAFRGCSSNLTIDFGNVGQTFQTFNANRHSALRSHTRTATCERPIPSAGPGALCIITYTWPPSRRSSEPLLVDCVDVDGASLPLPMQDVSGDYYPVYNCWGQRTATAPDGSAAPQPSFKQLAAEQYPDALANPDEWEVQLRPDDPTPTPTLDLAQVAQMLARDPPELDPWTNPVLLLWTDTNPDSTDTVDPTFGAALAVQSTRP